MNTISDDEIIKSAIKLVNEGLRVTFPVKGLSLAARRVLTSSNLLTYR